MLHKSRGIVLNHIKYGESSVIVHIYTEKFGIQSYIENGVRKQKAKNKIALFQPLTLLELVVYKKASGGINRISEIKCLHPYQSIPYQITKSTIGIFIAEILNNLLRGEEEENPGMFDFIHESLLFFDRQNHNFFNFHLQFLNDLSMYLGFSAANAEEMINEVKPYHPTKMNILTEAKLDELLSSNLTDELKLTGVERRALLSIIIQFFQIHSNSLKEIKSLKILHEVLS
ncbi:DNA repair protein RecO [Marivirga sp. S37H4]|uniref:DNA repair protein RecO n=1 Tax=Marivirga aurantiaca TaxID=2802615 RepID=A0A934WZM1_9BACT|nr:DNA repair protein RecO [Marivirga aurantiaca]MBK6265939.1 DNA repair protein RecO [Marivirga aurantiaca]